MFNMSKLDKRDIREIVDLAAQLVISRDSDVDMEDGAFATVDIDCLIRLDYAIAKSFGLDSDNVTPSETWKIDRELKEWNE